ncbi:MAG: ATPase component of various ABC-type transport system, containing duplicated ATPase [Fibrobacteres bacterium]|nr:ATPase component of various ABC-type transport system, containing duplicated ATPase [Fibrobacterota bacterium]
MPLLEVRDLKTHFRLQPGQDPSGEGAIRAVDGIDFTVERGEVLALVGESGSGKSVTSLSVLGLIPGTGFHAHGQILFQGRDLASLPEKEWLSIRGREISLVFQDPMNALNPVIACGEQVAESLRLHQGMSRTQARERALVLFKEVGIPDPDRRLDEYPHQMSGGMRQRVVIAMALACGPSLLIADEPTTALDVTVQAQILHLLLREQQARGMGILLITHDLGVVAETADRVAVMQAGKIVETATVKELFANPKHAYTRALLDAVPSLSKRPMASLTKRPTAAPPLLRVEALRTWFPIRTGILKRVTGQVKALDGFSLDIVRGETVGLVGESGCGKSTAGRTVLRLLDPTGGKVAWKGENVLTMDREALRAFRRRAQMIFQDPYSSLNPRMVVGRILEEPLRIHGLHKGKEAEKVAEMLEAVGLAPEYARRYPHEFSGGQRQRIAIARALITEPEFIVADEAVSSLDVSIQAQVLDLLAELKARLGLTFLFISHDLGVIRMISDRIAVMYLGRIVELADRDSLFASPLHPYTQALFSSIPRTLSGSGISAEKKRERIVLQGDVPNPSNPPAGCHFHTRCPYVMDRCRKEYPPLVRPADAGGLPEDPGAASCLVACWLHPGAPSA